MVAGLAFRNLYRKGAPSLRAKLLTADAHGVTYPPGCRLCLSLLRPRAAFALDPKCTPIRSSCESGDSGLPTALAGWRFPRRNRGEIHEGFRYFRFTQEGHRRRHCPDSDGDIRSRREFPICLVMNKVVYG